MHREHSSTAGMIFSAPKQNNPGKDYLPLPGMNSKPLSYLNIFPNFCTALLAQCYALNYQCPVKLAYRNIAGNYFYVNPCRCSRIQISNNFNLII